MHVTHQLSVKTPLNTTYGKNNEPKGRGTIYIYYLIKTNVNKLYVSTAFVIAVH